jgi:hypothetical protein
MPGRSLGKSKVPLWSGDQSDLELQPLVKRHYALEPWTPELITGGGLQQSNDSDQWAGTWLFIFFACTCLFLARIVGGLPFLGISLLIVSPPRWVFYLLAPLSLGIFFPDCSNADTAVRISPSSAAPAETTEQQTSVAPRTIFAVLVPTRAALRVTFSNVNCSPSCSAMCCPKQQPTMYCSSSRSKSRNSSRT